MQGKRLKLPSYRSLDAPGLGAVAHMSLHLTNNVKEPSNISGGQLTFPDFSTGGLLSYYVGDRATHTPFCRRQRCGGRAYMGHPRVGQRLFGNFISTGHKMANLRGFLFNLPPSRPLAQRRTPRQMAIPGDSRILLIGIAPLRWPNTLCLRRPGKSGARGTRRPA